MLPVNPVPQEPKIYHITHVNNLAGIIRDGVIWSDVKRIERGIVNQNIALTGIKDFRINKAVLCHAGTTVGQYTAFYFCPRSIMLCKIWYNNDPEMSYRGGQEPIVHLEFDLQDVIAWADHHHRKWTFTDRNARAGYASFFKDIDKLSEINWSAVQTTSFADSQIKDSKQAEFLCYESAPFGLVSKIGVYNSAIRQRVAEILSNINPAPTISIEPMWYY